MAIEHLRKTVGGAKLYARVAEYDSAGNKITDSLSTLTDAVDAVSDSVETITTSLDGKANLVQNPTTGNLASLTSTGDISDSGYGADNLVPTATNKQSQIIMDSAQDKPIWSSDAYGTFTINNPNMEMANIGGTEYVTIKVGNKWWMAENLDYKFDGCVIGSTEGITIAEARGNYYDNDEATYGRSGYRCGLLYNWKALNTLIINADTLIPGWHVPTYDEWLDFINYDDIEGFYHAYKFKKEGLYWAPNWRGTNENKFNVVPAGARQEEYVFIGTQTTFWSSSITTDHSAAYPTLKALKFDTSYNLGWDVNTGNGFLQFSVRLVRDAE